MLRPESFKKRERPEYWGPCESLDKEDELLGKKIEATKHESEHNGFEEGIIYYDGKKIYRSITEDNAVEILDALIATQTDPLEMSKDELENFAVDFQQDKEKREKRELTAEIKPIAKKIVSALKSKELERLKQDLPEEWQKIIESI